MYRISLQIWSRRWQRFNEKRPGNFRTFFIAVLQEFATIHGNNKLSIGCGSVDHAEGFGGSAGSGNDGGA